MWKIDNSDLFLYDCTFTSSDVTADFFHLL
jgi:hypothetical protein